MELPESIQRRFRQYGRAGGRTRARRLTAAARRSIARRAATCRWIRERFGQSSFAALGLPGGELMDAGLADLASGTESIASLVIAVAAPRLRREGIPVPGKLTPDPENRLFARVERESGSLAHARYLALLRQAVSFADACRIVRRRPRRHAK
jgi:hypothetical protein